MRSSHGFTLIELLSVTVILAILASIATPYCYTLHKRLEARIVTATLQELIHASRNYALNSHKALTICGSSDRVNCNGNWTVGALLMEDANRNGLLDGSDQILKFEGFDLSQAKLTWRGFSGNRVIIESFGTTLASNGSFTYCRLDADPLYRRQVIVNRAGRARPSRDANGDGIHENSQGSPIVCP